MGIRGSSWSLVCHVRAGWTEILWMAARCESLSLSLGLCDFQWWSAHRGRLLGHSGSLAQHSTVWRGREGGETNEQLEVCTCNLFMEASTLPLDQRMAAAGLGSRCVLGHVNGLTTHGRASLLSLFPQAQYTQSQTVITSPHHWMEMFLKWLFLWIIVFWGIGVGGMRWGKGSG